nr:MAG TPA_asm: hypothetical protein [Caudoviricetes sp.]
MNRILSFTLTTKSFISFIKYSSFIPLLLIS